MRKNCRDRATWHRCVWDSARRRARAKGIEFGLTEADIIAMAEDADHRCAVSGIPFDYSPLLRGDQYSRRPFFPSLDRIVPKGPYTRENVRLVLVAMNIALSDWGEDVFRLLEIVGALYVADQNRCVDEDQVAVNDPDPRPHLLLAPGAGGAERGAGRRGQQVGARRVV